MLINADAQSIPIPDGLVNCIVTSPPYWSLRRYQGEQERDWPAVSYAPMPGLPEVAAPAMRCALGLEPTPEAYMGHMVLIFRDLYRVLRDDGVIWCVMGDSYTSGGRVGHGNRVGHKQQSNRGMSGQDDPPRNDARLEDGNLLMIPQRLALALQGDGWTVRNDCVWSKKNCMPESVSGWRWGRHKIKVRSNRPPTRQDHLPPDGQRESGQRGNAWSDMQNQPDAEWRDCPGCPKCEANGGYILRRGSWRHTRAHEYVLMLTKEMGYFSNQEVAREGNHIIVRKAGRDGDKSGQDGRRALGFENNDTVTVGRNPRSVFHLASQPYPGTHYAVFPESLIAPLIRATTPTRCCPACGAGWAAVVERKTGIPESYRGSTFTDGKTHSARAELATVGTGERTVATNVLGYRPTCDCPPHDPVPGLVFDPFLGSGTTARVAKELGLRWVGADLSFEYLDLQAKVRTKSGMPSSALGDLPLFAALDTGWGLKAADVVVPEGKEDNGCAG